MVLLLLLLLLNPIKDFYICFFLFGYFKSLVGLLCFRYTLLNHFSECVDKVCVLSLKKKKKKICVWKVPRKFPSGKQSEQN